MDKVPAPVWNALLALLAALGSWLLAAAARWVQAHAQATRWGAVAVRLDDAADVAVREVAQTYADAIKSGAADGQLTAAEAAQARDQAVAKLRSYLGRPGLDALVKVVGLDPGALDGYLGGKVEAKVHELKGGAGTLLQAVEPAQKAGA